MKEAITYLSGRFVPLSECRLAIYDMGIVVGAAVTDLMRTFHRRPYRMEDHVRRFYRSCKYAHIRPTVSEAETMEISRKLIQHNSKLVPGRELGLVYYITAGENPAYAGAAALPRQVTPTFAQHTFPMPFHFWRDFFIDGIHCITPSIRHWPPQCLSSKIKHRNRLHMWIGDKEVRLGDPQAVALYLDLEGNITETGGSNFVIYRDGKVVSPRRRNILWGISLTVLAELLAKMGVPFVEEDIQVYDAVNADEAWMPTTPYCLAPVVKINGKPIGNGKPGRMWRRVLDAWSKAVKKDIYREVTSTAIPGQTPPRAGRASRRS